MPDRSSPAPDKNKRIAWIDYGVALLVMWLGWYCYRHFLVIDADKPKRGKAEIDSFGGHPRSLEEKRMQRVFLSSTFGMLAKLCKADGPVTQAEIHAIENYMTETLKLDEDRRSLAIDLFTAGKESVYGFDHYAQVFYEIFSGHPALLESLIEILFQVGASNEVFSSEKERLIAQAAKTFGLSGRRYQALRGKYYDELDQPYRILGCTKDDSSEVIRKRYRALCAEWHPDKMSSKGLPQDFASIAKSKFIEIQEAYDTIRRSRDIL